MIFRITFYFCFISAGLFSQVFTGTVLDKNTRKPIPDCLVILKGTTKTSVTGTDGKFSISFPVNNPNTSLIVTLIGYNTIEYKVSEKRNDTIYMVSKNIQLKEVTITANKKNILNPKSTDAILDFDLLDDNLVLLTAGDGKNNLKLIDDFGESITSLKVHKHSESLKHDCIGNLQLFSPDSVWQVFYDYVKLNSMNPYSLANYNEILGHCVCSDNNSYYFQSLTYRKLRTEYFYYKESEKGVRHSLVKFQDTSKIRCFELDYDLHYFLKVRLDSKYTIYNEPIDVIKKNIDTYREQLELDWAYNKWLGSVETEMVKTDSNLFIVNFTDTVIYSVDKSNNVKFNSKFNVLRYRNLLHKVYTDQEYRENYLVQFADNILSVIKFDITSGKEIAKTEIANTPYLPRKIIINGGKAYFIQKNLVDDQPYKVIKYYLN